MKYAFIHEHRVAWPVTVQCDVLDVSRGGYYDWTRRTPSPRQHRHEELIDRIAEVFGEHRGRYGSPRVHATLVASGHEVCLNTVAKWMRESGLLARRKPRYVPKTTDSTHDAPVAKNLLGRDFTADKRDRRWVCDITYVPTDEGWLYVAAVMDLFSRKIVGWSMTDHLRAGLCVDALTMALARRNPDAGLLHHSDRGVQYACEDYRRLLERERIVCSMSGRGDCYDNAAMESFWATLKTELVHHERYATREQARASLFEYMEVYYNRKRLHSVLGYQSPTTFEAALN